MVTESWILGSDVRDAENLLTKRGLATKSMDGLQESVNPKITYKNLDVCVFFWKKDLLAFIRYFLNRGVINITLY